MLEKIKALGAKASYDAEHKLIVVSTKAKKVIEMLDAEGYTCDNEVLLVRPKIPHELLVYADKSEPNNKGYLITS